MSGFYMNQSYDPASILIYDRKKGTRLKETSLIAFDKTTGKVLAAGNDAVPLSKRKDPNVIVLSPLKEGVIADYEAAYAMFRYLLEKASLPRLLSRPKVVICVPADLTDVERKAFLEIFYQMKAKEVSLSEETAERLHQALPAVYRILVGIVREEAGGRAGIERWEEFRKGLIPAGRYHAISITTRGSEAALEADMVESTFEGLRDSKDSGESADVMRWSGAVGGRADAGGVASDGAAGGPVGGPEAAGAGERDAPRGLAGENADKTIVSLSSHMNRVEITFGKIIAMRMVARGAIPDGLYPDGGRIRFGNGRLQNTIYQVVEGEFSRSILANGRGKGGEQTVKHYLIISEEAIAEVLAENEPEISVSALQPEHP